MASRRLIVTADDFGVSSDVNEAVIRGHKEGVLRFASLMVSEPGAAEAVDRAKRECPDLRLGLHAVLCAGRSELALSGLTEEGRFPDDPVTCGLRYFFDRSLQAPIERELRAQFERYLAFGLEPGHVDGHVNVHAHPVVFPILSRLAKEYGFRRIRLPGGEFGLSMAYSPRPFIKQVVEAITFALLRHYLIRAHSSAGLEIPDRVFGLLRSGLMKEDYVSHCLQSLPEGHIEIYLHPSSDPTSEAGDRPVPTHRSISELKTLLSERVRDLIRRGAIELL